MSTEGRAWREHEHARTSPPAEDEPVTKVCRTCLSFDKPSRWCNAVDAQVVNSGLADCPYWNGGES